jgi:phosphocarrier protein HPr
MSRKLSARVIIPNKRGLHARASAKIVEAAARFQSQIYVIKDGTSVDGRSIMGLMMLAASIGSQVEITAEGPDADEALKALLALVEAKFGEECCWAASGPTSLPSPPARQRGQLGWR